jgi:hypothetical protein
MRKEISGGPPEGISHSIISETRGLEKERKNEDDYDDDEGEWSLKFSENFIL